MTWGDPLLTAWLEAVRGDHLTPEVYRLAGLEPGATRCMRQPPHAPEFVGDGVPTTLVPGWSQ